MIATDASFSTGALVHAIVGRIEQTDLLRSLRYIGGTLPVADPVIEFVQYHSWKIGFAHEWQIREHINVLERYTIVMAIEWLISHGAKGHRLIYLVDSSICMAALTKGRSSKPDILRIARKIAALCLAADIEVLFLHIVSEQNPADDLND